jgi:hypothetical protein
MISDVAFSQKIIRIYKSYVLLNVYQYFGLEVNDIVSVYRKSHSVQNMYIGLIKIIKFQAGMCAAKIISERQDKEISLGDFIDIKTFNNDNNFWKEFWDKWETTSYEKKSNHPFTILCIMSGAMLSWAGYNFLKKADDIYTKYEVAKTSKDAIHLFDKTLNYDKYSNVSFFVGGGLVALGLLRVISKHNSKPFYNYNDMSLLIIPVHRHEYVGLKVTLSLYNPQ